MFDRAQARGNGHRQDDDDEDERHLGQVRPDGSGATSAGETADVRGAGPAASAAQGRRRRGESALSLPTASSRPGNIPGHARREKVPSAWSPRWRCSPAFGIA